MLIQDPPPPVILRESDFPDLVSRYPVLGDGNSKFVFMAIQAKGALEVLQQAQKSLEQQGWDASLIKDRTGAMVLGIGFEHRAVSDATALYRRLNAHEFGAVELAPVLIPVPSEAKK